MVLFIKDGFEADKLPLDTGTERDISTVLPSRIKLTLSSQCCLVWETDRQMYGQNGRQIYQEMDRHADSYTDMLTDQTGRSVDRYTGSQTVSQRNRLANQDRRTDRQTDRQTDRKTKRQKDRKTNQTEVRKSHFYDSKLKEISSVYTTIHNFAKQKAALNQKNVYIQKKKRKKKGGNENK